MSSWSFFLAIIPTMIAICGFVDRISSDAIRFRLAELITGHDSKQKIQGPANFTKYFIENTIGNLYKGHHITTRNSYKSFILSLISFFVITYIVCVFNDVSPRKLFSIVPNFLSSENIVVFIILIFGMLITDILSFLQTAMFMRIAGKIERFGEMLLMIACDLIVTVNIFIFIFPFLLTLTIYFLDARGRDFEFTAVLQDKEEPIESQRRSESISDRYKEMKDYSSAYDFKTYDLSFIAHVMGYPRQNTRSGRTTSSYIAVKNMDPNIALARFISSIGSDSLVVPRQPDTSRQELSRWIRGSSRNIGPITPTPEEIQAVQGKTDIVFHTNLHGAFSQINPIQLYFSMYSMGHIVQDQFLLLIQLNIVDLDLNPIMWQTERESFSIPYSDISNYFVICDGVVDYVDKLDQANNCQSMSIIPVGDIFRETYSSSFIFFKLGDIPISIYASTALFLTMIFYIGMFLFVFGYKFGAIFRLIALEKQFIDIKKFPFTTMSLYITAIISPLAILILAIELINN